MMKRPVIKSIFFLLLFILSSFCALAQTTVNFNSYTENQGLSNPHTEGELEFEVIKSTSICTVCIGIDFNDGKDGTPGLDDDNFEVNGIVGWKISKADNSSFQFLSIWLQHRGAGTSTSGTINAFKGGFQVGAAKPLIFNSSSSGVKSYASDPDFYDVDSILIKGTDLYLILDEITYGAPFVVGDADPAVVTGINLVGAPLSNVTSVQYQISFSKLAKNVSADDFILTTTGTAAGTIGTVTGSNATYSVPISGISGEGTLQLDLKAGTDIANENDVIGTAAFTTGQIHNVSPCLVEDFEDETVGSKGFSYGGFDFVITGNMEVHTEIPVSGINGSRNVLNNTGVGPYILTSNSGEINLRRIALYLSSIADGSSPTNDGSITLTGKKAGNIVYTISKDSGFPTDFSANSGYYILDLRTEGGTDNSLLSIDQLEITLGGSFQYINIDNFEFCADDVAPSGYTVSIDQDPITQDNENAVSFTFAAAEIGTTYEYTFTSSGGGTPVTGTGTILTATDQTTGINLSGLGVGTVNLTVSLTDASNNRGLPATTNVQKRINTAPVATPPSAPVVMEDITVALADDIQVADNEGDDQTVTFTITGGTVTLGTTGITFGGSGNGSANFTASGTLAAINTALDAATFTPALDLFGTNAGIISFVTNDGSVDSNIATVTFDIQAINDSPNFGTITGNKDYNEGSSATDLGTVLLSDGDNVSSPTDETISKATITNTIPATGDMISVGTPGPYAVSTAGDVTTISGSGSIEDMIATLASLTFENTTDDPTEGDANINRSITITVEDDDAAVSNVLTFNIRVIPTNDDPTLIGLPNDISVQDGVASNIDLSTAIFGDVDSGSGNVLLSFLVSGGTLSATSTADVAVSFPIPGAMDLVGTAAAIGAFLNTPSNILYTNAPGATGDNAATLNVSANDNGNTGTGGGLPVNLGTINIDVQELPSVSSVSVPANGTYSATQNLDFTVNYSEPVIISGVPSFELTLGSTVYEAEYVSGSGSSALLFRYTVQQGDLDTDGISVGAIITLKGGSIQNSSTVDASLNLNSVGSTAAVLIDAVAPAAPSTPDLSASTDTGSSNTDNITSDNTPTFIGTAEPNSLVSLQSNVNGTLGAVTADGSGNWSFTPGIPVADGGHEITAVSTDNAGNSSIASASLQIEIDTQAPPIPSVPDLLSGDDSGISDSDNITNEVTPTIEGLAEAGSTVVISSTIDGELGTTSVNASGQWSYTTVTNLSVNKHDITVTANDVAGNSSASSASLGLTIDTYAPIVIIKNLLVYQLDENGKTPTLNVNDFLLGLPSDNFSAVGNIVIALSKSTYDCANVGYNVVRVIATDEAGNSDFAETYIEIQDNIDPVINAKNITLNVDAFGSVNLSSTMIDDGSTDNCGIATWALSKTIFTAADAGLNNVTYNIYDSFGNFASTVVEVTVVVVPNVLTITADPGQSKLLGALDPVFTYKASGFEGADDETILTGSLSRAAGENVGNYAITAGDLDAGQNYSINFIPADFEIKLATITGVTFTDDSFVYDGTAKSLAITGTLPVGTAVAYTDNSRADVGTHEVTATISGTNFTTLELKADLTITPATVIGVTFTDDSFVYDGTAKSLAITGTLPVGTAVTYTDNSRTDVGTQEVTATISGANFTTLELKADLTITPATVMGVTFTDDSFVYDGTAKSLAITGTLPVGTAVTYTDNSRTDVGTQEVTATISGSNFTNLELKADLTITPATVMGVIFTDDSFVYDGTAKSLAITGTLPAGTAVAYTNNSRTDVGTQEVTATISGANFTTLELKADLTITPATVMGVTFTDDSFVYDGTAKSLAITGTLPVGTAVAYTNNSRTDVGTQEVTATISGSNFTNLELKADLTITPATVMGVTFRDDNFVYDGTSKSLAITGTLPVGTAVTYTDNSRTDVGIQEVTATISGANYTTLVLKSDLTITPATVTGVTFTDDSFVYDGTAKSLAITGTLPVGTAVAYTNNSRTDVGTQEVTATISGSNFTTQDLKADLTITPATVMGVTFTDDSFVYDGTAKSLAITGTLPVGTAVTYTNNSRTDVGTQEVTATISGANFNTLELKADLTITPATVMGVTFTDDNFVYDGTSKSLAITGTLPVGTAVAYTNNSRTDVGTQEVTATISGANYTMLELKADLTITPATVMGVAFTDDNFVYDGTAKSLAITGTLPVGTAVAYTNNSRTDVGLQEVTATISGSNYFTLVLTANLEVTPAIIPGLGFSSGSFVYDGTAKSLMISGTLPSGTSVAYTNNSRTDVGTQEVTATISGSNYNQLVVKADLTITPATITGITLANGSFVYDGTAKSLMIFGTLPSGTSVAYIKNSRTDVGTQEVTATISGSNYNQLVVKADLTITPATITGITLADGSFVYDGTAKSLMISGTLPSGTSVAYTDNSRTEVGSQEAIATISGSNYSTLVLKADLTVLPANIAGLTFEDGTIEYDGTGKSLEITGTLPAGTSVTYANNSRTEVGSQVVTATISGSNFTEVSLTADLSITPATLSVVADEGQRKEFGSIEPVLTYDVTGFKGADTDAILSGALSREPGEDVGTYLINQGSLGAGNNYTIDFTGAEFSIVEEPNIDSDGDGVPDDVEQEQGTDLQDPLDYLDTDGDDVPDYVEGQQGTDPTDAGDYVDTDGDDVPDYIEEQQGTDPNNDTDFLDADGDGVPDYVQDRAITEFVTQSLEAVWGTAADELKVPEDVIAITAKGEFINLAVTWDLGGYDPLNSGINNHEGAVVFPAGLFNPAGLQSNLVIIVLAKPAPEDVSLSANSFIGIPDQYFQEIGAFTVIDPTDELHTLSLAAGIQDNDYFEVLDGILFWSSAEQAPGRTAFTIKLTVLDRAGNVLEKSFQISRTRTLLEQLDVSNTFTPNGDGANDTWGVLALRYYTGVRISVMNLGGERVFYTENPDLKWDGQFNGKAMPVGSYLYVIEVGETGEVRRGMLNLLRQ